MTCVTRCFGFFVPTRNLLRYSLLLRVCSFLVSIGSCTSCWGCSGCWASSSLPSPCFKACSSTSSASWSTTFSLWLGLPTTGNPGANFKGFFGKAFGLVRKLLYQPYPCSSPRACCSSHSFWLHNSCWGCHDVQVIVAFCRLAKPYSRKPSWTMFVLHRLLKNLDVLRKVDVPSAIHNRRVWWKPSDWFDKVLVWLKRWPMQSPI